MSRNEMRDVICGVLRDDVAAFDWTSLSALEWREFVQTARAERVGPLLCAAFRRHGWPTDIPRGVREVLSREYYNSVANASLLFQELESVLLTLEAVDVHSILLKGAALATTVYPDCALRPMGDVDLLIQPAALQTAIRQVEALGFAREAPCMRQGKEHLFFYEVNFQSTGGLALLELHWDLIGGEGSRLRPDIHWFWSETRPVRIGRAVAQVLSPEAHFLHAAVHVALKHGPDTANLLWLYDLHLILSQCPDFDWELLFTKAGEFHWSPVLLEVLPQLQALFGTHIPSEAVEALAGINDPETESLARRLAAQDQTRTAGAWNHLGFLSWSARLQWLAAVVFPDPAYIQWRYTPTPPQFWPLCYFRRWGAMLADGIRTLIRFPRRS